MTRIADVLELLTDQHEEIERLVQLVGETSDVEDRHRILDGLGTKLTMHLAIEQELIYPEIGGIVAAHVIREVMAEHSEIKRILADLLWLEPVGPHFESRLAALRTLLEGHAAWQEDALFGEVAATVPAARLAMLAESALAWSEPMVFERVAA